MEYSKATVTDSPYFTIVIVCLNAGEELIATVQSVLKQSFQDYEIIVKDAGSKDGSIQKLPRDKRIRVIVSEDTGLYHAMNQATEIAKGKYLYYLNCGDYLYDEEVLQNVYNVAVKCSDPGLLYGESFYRKLNKMRVPPEIINPYFWSISNICHQAVFFLRESLPSNGVYDLSYHISADNELMVRQFQAGVRFVSLGFPVCSYEGGGYSESKKGMQIGKKEHRRIMNTYFSLIEQSGFFLKHCYLYLKKRIWRQ